jgi:hypothetical protein
MYLFLAIFAFLSLRLAFFAVQKASTPLYF